MYVESTKICPQIFAPRYYNMTKYLPSSNMPERLLFYHLNRTIFITFTLLTHYIYYKISLYINPKYTIECFSSGNLDNNFYLVLSRLIIECLMQYIICIHLVICLCVDFMLAGYE